jgi:PAS domain S-box-containing protein
MEPRDYKHLLRQTVLLPVLLIALLAAALFYQVTLLTRSMQTVHRSDEVAARSRLFLRGALDMESGLRGYLLTGDPRVLEPYLSGAPLAENSLEILKTETTGDPAAARAAADLRIRFDEWHKHADDLVANPPKPGSVKELEEHLEGVQKMASIRQARDTLLNQIEAQRAASSDAFRFATRTALIVLALLSAAVAAVIATITHRRMSALLEYYTNLLSQEHQRTAEVQEAREWLLTILRGIGDGVISTDAEGRIAFMNSVAEQITGWERLSAIGASISNVLVLSDAVTHKPLPNLIETLRDSHSPVPASEALLRRKDGVQINVDQSLAPILNSDGHMSGAVLVIRDTTERHRSEAALRSSERLAILGRLSATIAHEIRNPLEAVTNLMFLMRSTKLGPEALDYLNSADEEIRRVSQTTNQLLSFNREVHAPGEVDIRQVLEGVLTLFGPKLHDAHISVGRKYKGNGKVYGLPGELRQVFSNLIANAIDAQPNGGRILVRVSPDHDWTDGLRHGVRIIVSDTGPGIPETVKTSLFTAFYTTKGEKGTGLGLWVSRGIIAKHRGTIHMRSSTDGKFRGTTFSIFLPSPAEAHEVAA